MTQRPQMRDALRASLSAEQKAVQDRFARAETVLALTEVKQQRAEPREKTPAPPPKPKEKRPKVMRRTFALTDTEYELIFELKRRCNLEGFEAAQSELIRAGLHQLAKLDSGALQNAMQELTKLRRGRVAE